MSKKIEFGPEKIQATSPDVRPLTMTRSWWQKYHNHVYGLSSVIGLAATFVFFFIQTEPPDPVPFQAPTPDSVTVSTSSSSPFLFDEDVSDVAKKILGTIQMADAVIGVTNWRWSFSDWEWYADGLISPVPAKDWVRKARTEANYEIFKGSDQEQFIRHLSVNKLLLDWMIQFDEQEPITLESWIRENVDLPVPDDSESPTSE